MPAMKSKYTVIIVGAGPVGLLTAIRLGQAGISTLVLEGHASLLRTTRAVAYMPVVLPVFQELGVLERIKEIAFVNREGIAWRNPQGEILGSLITADEDGEAQLLCGQFRVNGLLLDEAKQYPSVDIRMGMRTVGVDYTKEDSVRVMTHDGSVEDGDHFFEGDYVVGADGANSTVRRSSCIPFEGFSWSDWKMMGCDVWYDFKKENGYTNFQYIIDSKNWAIIVYTGLDDEDGNPMWRVSYPEAADLSDDRQEQTQRAQENIPTYMKGWKDFKISRAEHYEMRQRCAAQAIKGRVMLAGDALHSNNPLGGLGLTGGILDAYVYGNALVRVIKGHEPASLLAKAANARRDTWLNVTNPESISQLSLIRSPKSEDAERRKVFFEKMKTDVDFPKYFVKKVKGLIVDTFDEGVKDLLKKTDNHMWEQKMSKISLS